MDGAAAVFYVFLMIVMAIVAVWLYVKGLGMSLDRAVVLTAPDHVEEKGNGEWLAGVFVMVLATALAASALHPFGIAPWIVVAVAVVIAVMKWMEAWYAEMMRKRQAILKSKTAAPEQQMPLGLMEWKATRSAGMSYQAPTSVDGVGYWS
jgi:hypothetical protein